MTDPNDADDRSELQAAVPSSLRRNGPAQELKDSWEPGPGYADTWGPYYSAQFPPTKVTPWINFKRMGSGVNVVRGIGTSARSCAQPTKASTAAIQKLAPSPSGDRDRRGAVRRPCGVPGLPVDRPARHLNGGTRMA